MAVKRIFFKLLWLIIIMTFFTARSIYAEPVTIRYVGGSNPFSISADNQTNPTDLFQDFKNLMPGDYVQSDIYLQNDCQTADSISLYLRAESIQTEKQLTPYTKQHTEDVAVINEFLSRLDMKVWKQNLTASQNSNPVLIYHASPDRPEQLSSQVSLGSLSHDEKILLHLELSAPLTLGNDVIGDVGEVHWMFAAEEHQNKPNDKPNPNNSNIELNNTDNKKESLFPSTGQAVLYRKCLIALFLMLFVIGIFLKYSSIKRSRRVK